MPMIRPVSDLRNNFQNISKACHDGDEPIFLTKNGHGDMVVMSQDLYEKQQAMIALYQKLAEAEEEDKAEAEMFSHEKVMEELRNDVYGKEVQD